MNFLFCFYWKDSYQGLGPLFSPGHSLHGAAAGQNRASRAAAMPLLICLQLKSVKSVLGSTIDNVISHLQQVVEQMQSRQALTQHSSCGSTSPGTCHEKVNTHARHGFFLKTLCLDGDNLHPPCSGLTCCPPPVMFTLYHESLRQGSLCHSAWLRTPVLKMKANPPSARWKDLMEKPTSLKGWDYAVWAIAFGSQILKG